MSTEDFIIELFCRVDDGMLDVPKHPQAKLYPSEVVTLALLFALRGVGNRAYYRWLKRDFGHLFPKLPERTRLFRLFKARSAWASFPPPHEYNAIYETDHLAPMVTRVLQNMRASVG